MHKEQGFNQTQINQLVDAVRTIIKEEVPPMIDQKLEPINQRLDKIEQDIKDIKIEAKKHNWNI